MSEDRSTGSNITTLYIERGSCHQLAGGRSPARQRSPLHEDWEGDVIPFRRDASKAPRAGRFDFLRGAELLDSNVSGSARLEIKLRLRARVASPLGAVFAAAARACRVVWTDMYGHAWVHRVLGVMVSAWDSREIILRLEVRRAADVGRWEEDQRLGLGGEKIPLPPVGHLIVVSRGEETVATDPLRLSAVSRVS